MSDRAQSPSPDDEITPASSGVDVDALGCAKCRWSIVGCAKCRVCPVSDRSRCPPLEARPGYARYAASVGLVVSKTRRARVTSARDGKRETSEKAAETDSDAEEDGGTATRRVKAARMDEAVTIEAMMREKAAEAERERQRARAAAAAAAAAREASREERWLKVDVDCGPYRSDVVGKNDDNLKILKFKSGARLQAHATSETIVEVHGTQEAIAKAKALIAEAIQKAEEKRMTRAKTPVQPKKPSLDVMSIVNDIRRPAMREKYELTPGKFDSDAEEPEDVLSPEARSAVQGFIDKLPRLTKSRVTIAEFTNEALLMSSYEGVPAVIVSTIRDRIASETSSATMRLTLLYLLDSIAQASRVESRGGSDATHAMYVRALRRNLSDIVKHMIMVIKVDEATEMKDVEVPVDATIGEAHARYRRQAVQKILSLWEKREVLAPNDIAIGKKAISKFRHEALKKQVREFDRRLERQPEAKIKVQSDGLNANEFDDIAAMLGNQYGGIDVNVLDLSMLRSKNSPTDRTVPTQPTAQATASPTIDHHSSYGA